MPPRRLKNEEEDNDEEEELYCICKKKYLEGQFMIECGKCNEWFHGSCVGIEEYQAQDIDVYHCPNCQPEHGPLVYSFLDVKFENGILQPTDVKRRRNTSRHNYRDIHEGTKQITNGSVMFVRQLKAKKFYEAYDIIEQFEDGRVINGDYFQEYGFEKPILIHEKSGLGLVVPPSNFTIYDVEKRIGSMFELHVIDVSRQEDLRMKMREWTEYYNSPVRGKVLNVISCEFSSTSLNDLVMAPEIVRYISWVENAWPKDPPVESPHRRPVVAKYCLMSVKDCYTDFHVDFGGTSVWYHILRGEKIFYLIEPTDENLRKYENWVSSSDQSQVFLADKVDKCYKLHIKQGNTLLIPTGWIHAVLTPKDSLVFGGNFLHSFNIPLQSKIYKLEKSLNTPLKFLFPNFETTNWYAARLIVKKIKDIHAAGFRMPYFLQQGVLALIESFKSWSSSRGEYVKYHKLQTPIEISANKLIKSLEKILKADERIDPSKEFPTGRLPSPALLSVKASKTVLKLKLSRKSESEDHSSDPERQTNIEKLERKRDKLRKREQKLKHEITSSSSTTSSTANKKTLPSIKLNLKNEEITRDVYENEKQIKLKLSLPTTTIQKADPDDSSPDVTSPYKQPFSHQPPTPVDLKAEIEAAKRDLFQPDSPEKKPKGLYFERHEEQQKFPLSSRIDTSSDGYTESQDSQDSKDSDDDDGGGGYVVDFLPRPKPQLEKKRKNQNRSDEEDSDYNPGEDSYYQDAEFVYPRIDVTSDITQDDFSWKPGQRKKPKTCSYKKDREVSKPVRKMSDSDDFFAPDNSDDELFRSNPKPHMTQRKSNETFSSTKPLNKKGPKNKPSTASASSSTSSSVSTTVNKDVNKVSKERSKKGMSTAKQRLGKLLKLDKTGSRYMR